MGQVQRQLYGEFAKGGQRWFLSPSTCSFIFKITVCLFVFSEEKLGIFFKLKTKHLLAIQAIERGLVL